MQDLHSVLLLRFAKIVRLNYQPENNGSLSEFIPINSSCETGVNAVKLKPAETRGQMFWRRAVFY